MALATANNPEDPTPEPGNSPMGCLKGCGLVYLGLVLVAGVVITFAGVSYGWSEVLWIGIYWVPYILFLFPDLLSSPEFLVVSLSWLVVFLAGIAGIVLLIAVVWADLWVLFTLGRALLGKVFERDEDRHRE